MRIEKNLEEARLATISIAKYSKIIGFVARSIIKHELIVDLIKIVL
jgi:hypothetical protein